MSFFVISIPYKSVDMKGNGHLKNVLIAHKQSPFHIFMSNTCKIPTVDIGNPYKAILNFIVPRSYLDKRLAFFLTVKDSKTVVPHSMPNTIAGYIEVVGEQLKASL